MRCFPASLPHRSSCRCWLNHRGNAGSRGSCDDKVLGDCFRDNFYGKLKALSAGRNQVAQRVGRAVDRNLSTFRHADQLAFSPATRHAPGEFWYPYRGLNKPPAMTAHIPGLRWRQRAFTHMQTTGRLPGGSQAVRDAAFCDGVNHFTLHLLPRRRVRQAGDQYFAGSHINPNVTVRPVRRFLAYLARCQLLLRQAFRRTSAATRAICPPALGPGRNMGPRRVAAARQGYSYDWSTPGAAIALSVDRRSGLADGMRYRGWPSTWRTRWTPRARRRCQLAESGATWCWVIAARCRAGGRLSAVR